MPGTGAPGQAGPGLQGCAALCHSGATEPELPGDTEEAQHQHPGEGELDPEGGPSYKPRHPLPIPSRDQLGQQDTRAGLPPLLGWSGHVHRNSWAGAPVCEDQRQPWMLVQGYKPDRTSIPVFSIPDGGFKKIAT